MELFSFVVLWSLSHILLCCSQCYQKWVMEQLGDRAGRQQGSLKQQQTALTGQAVKSLYYIFSQVAFQRRSIPFRCGTERRQCLLCGFDPYGATPILFQALPLSLQGQLGGPCALDTISMAQSLLRWAGFILRSLWRGLVRRPLSGKLCCCNCMPCILSKHKYSNCVGPTLRNPFQ